MLNTKKILAAALAATMVFGSSISVFAEDPVTSGGSDGAGASEGHLEKEVLNVVLPTVPDGSTPFNYTMDPERLIRETEGAKYAEGTTFPEAEGDTGVYFQTAEKTYANKSNVLQAINKSSCDVKLSVKVNTTQKSDKDIALATSSTVATEGTPNLYLGLVVGSTKTTVKAEEQTVDKVIAGTPGNFETTVVTNDSGVKSYAYKEKADASTWKAMNISMEGAVSNLAIAADATAPTVNVTWAYEKATTGTAAEDAVDYSTAPAGPSLSQNSYAKDAQNTAIEVTVNNLGEDTIASLETGGTAVAGSLYTINGNKVTLSSALLRYITEDATFKINTAGGVQLTFTVTVG